MSLIKYRVHEVAKDFDVQSKDIVNILSKYAEAPKNNQKVLDDSELNIIFDSITEDNQVANLMDAFALAKNPANAVPSAPVSEPESVKASAADEKVPPVSSSTVPVSSTVAAPAAEKAEIPTPVKISGQTAPATSTAPQTIRKPAETTVSVQAPRPAVPAAQTQKNAKQTIHVDTRAAGTKADLSKYDERIDALVPEHLRNASNSKQKIKKVVDKKTAGLSQKRRQEEIEKMKRLQKQQEAAKKAILKVMIPDEIAVGELASRLKKTGSDVVKALMKQGLMVSVSQTIDYDTAALIALEFGAKVEHEVHLTIEERLIDVHEDKPEDLLPRDPVIVVMGHVDHGKTSLLDFVRKAHVASGEAGGITQRIGAYRVNVGGRNLTFLDTPGHAAFTSMRARGALVTDIAILVVAADDGIMPQTIEAINHAKAAKIPIIVAINKIDRPNANPERILQQLTEHGLVWDEWGGDTVVCKISALTGEGIGDLLEMVLLTADMCDLKANPNRSATGSVIEAKLDKGRGPVATLLVQNGTIKAGDLVIAGKSVGRIRAMTDETGKRIESAGPSVPVEIDGLSNVPDAGDQFNVVNDERMARELVEQRIQDDRNKLNKPQAKLSLNDLYSQIKEGEIKDFNIIIKADVVGSVEAIRNSLEKLSNSEVRINVLQGAVGAISESDIMLADASNAIIIGFNVRASADARVSADQTGVDIRYYRVIYDCIEEIQSAMKGLLAPKYREVILGTAEVRQIFKASGIGTIAGCMVRQGIIRRNTKVRVIRDGIVVYEGTLSGLKRFKDDAREVPTGYECGITIDGYNDIRENDLLENFFMEEYRD